MRDSPLPEPGDIPGPATTIERYSARPLPPYRYVPGVHPHPVRDPRGHSHQPEPVLNRHPPWSRESWRELDDWLYGVDLFNAHYFWEAHEAWEGLWASRDRSSIPALGLQGLIQIAAALLKAHLGSAAGARVLSREGLEKLRRVAAEDRAFMGLDLPAAIEALESCFAPLAEDRLPPVASAPTLTLRGAPVVA